MPDIPLDARQAYQRLGVSPVINAAGSVTKYGGTRTRPEVLEVMAGAARIMVNVDDLNRKAGEEIARLTGAEADDILALGAQFLGLGRDGQRQ